GADGGETVPMARAARLPSSPRGAAAGARRSRPARPRLRSRPVLRGSGAGRRADASGPGRAPAGGQRRVPRPRGGVPAARLPGGRGRGGGGVERGGRGRRASAWSGAGGGGFGRRR